MLYLKFCAMHFKSQMQHKTSFFFTVVGQFLVAFATFLSVSFLFERFDSVGGFSYDEVLICFATITISFSLAELFGRGFDRFPQLLGNGGFDRALVRPRNIIFLVLASQMEFARFGRVAQAILIFVFVIPRAEIFWAWDKIFVLALMILCGSFVFFALFLLYAAFSFFTTEGLEVMNIFTDGAKEHGRLPFSVYGDGVLKFLTYVVPVALVQYYPLLYLVGREENFIFAFAPLFSLIFLLPCAIFFRFGVKKYKSTGS